MEMVPWSAAWVGGDKCPRVGTTWIRTSITLGRRDLRLFALPQQHHRAPFPTPQLNKKLRTAIAILKIDSEFNAEMLLAIDLVQSVFELQVQVHAQAGVVKDVELEVLTLRRSENEHTDLQLRNGSPPHKNHRCSLISRSQPQVRMAVRPRGDRGTGDCANDKSVVIMKVSETITTISMGN